MFAPIPYDKTREIYYRVTGRPIEAEPAPRVGAGLPGRRRQDDARWDVNQGGDQVGVIAWRGLSLHSSRFDGSVDARAAVAYVEWTFELKNDAPVPREARAELALPPGGVVSRVTLWIDGQSSARRRSPGATSPAARTSAWWARGAIRSSSPRARPTGSWCSASRCCRTAA